MKQGSFKVVCLLFLVCIAVSSAYGVEGANRWETRILENFNGESEFVWQTMASRFATQTEEMSFPRLAFIDAWPVAGFGHNRDGSQVLRSLGINGRFDRRGHNWIDIFPTREGDPNTPVEIPIPGRVRLLDMWVWGSNHHLSLDVYVRDHNGMIHILRMGDLNFAGWRNLQVNVPTTISQTRRHLPRMASLSFVKFRIWTHPNERVDNFFVYFKQLKALTDVFEAYFDGSELGHPSMIQELWSNVN